MPEIIENMETTELPKQKWERFNKLTDTREAKLNRLTNQTDAQLFHNRVNIEQDFTNQHDTSSFTSLTSLESSMWQMVGTDLWTEIWVTQESMHQRNERINAMKEQQQAVRRKIDRVLPTIINADKVLVTLHQVYSWWGEIKFTPTQMAQRENIKANGTLDTQQTHMSWTTENDQNTWVSEIALRIDKKSESTVPGFHISISKTYTDWNSTVSIYDYNAISGDLSLDGKPGATLWPDLADKLIERIIQAENARVWRSSINENFQRKQQQQWAENWLNQELQTG